jgi:hypothetical protein
MKENNKMHIDNIIKKLAYETSFDYKIELCNKCNNNGKKCECKDNNA